MADLAPLDTSPLPLKLRVEDYLLLDRSGAFLDYAKTELIEGEIFHISAPHRPHGLVKMNLYDCLRDALRAVQSPLRPMTEMSIAIPPHNVPEPACSATNWMRIARQSG